MVYIDPSGKDFIGWWEDNIVQPTADGILIHWNRNVGCNEPANLPNSVDSAGKQGWKKLTDCKSLYHRLNGAAGNIKFVSPGGHLEAVYDINGKLVTDVYNLGTYNYYSPTQDPIKHGVFDLGVYLIYGNSPEDFEDFWPRLSMTLGLPYYYAFHYFNGENVGK